MPTFLDDAPFTTDAATLDGVLDAAQQDVQANGRLIVEVSLDGQPLVGDDLEARRTQPIDDAEVRLYTADGAQIAAEALREVRQSIDQIDQLHDRAAEQLQRGDQAEGMQTVGQVIELWLGVQRAVGQSAQVAGINLDGFEFGDTSAKALFAGLLERLQELKALIEANDTVALADALAYEWNEITGPWAELVDTLTARVESTDAD